MRLGRKPRAVLAIATTITAVIAAFAITPSLASWTDSEYDHGSVSPLNCADAGTFTTNAWGQELSGQVAGTPLDASNLAGTLGVSATSGTPHSTAAGGSGSAGLNYLTNDAWSNDLQAGALDAISVGAGITLPIGQNLGAETQYGRAASSGQSTGAAGLLTSAGGGLVSLATPTGTTPGVGSISLDSALSSIVGSQLGSDITQLANASVTVGAVGSTTELDSCNALWQGESDAAAVVRRYVLARLGLGFSSSLVGTVATDAATTVSGLTTTLNGLQNIGTAVTNSSVNTAIASALTPTLSAAGISLGGTAVNVGVSFDLAPVTALLASTLTSGPVTIDLGTGAITADIGSLAGVDLNSLPANTSLIDSTTMLALTNHIKDAVDTFIGGAFTSALTAALSAATVTVHLVADLRILGIDAAGLTVGISGSAAQFLAPGGSAGVPLVSVADVDIAGAATVLEALGVDLDPLLNGVVSNLVTPVATTVVPAIATAVVSPTLALATSTVTSAVTLLSGTTLPLVLSALAAVVDVLGDALQLTVNAEPDQTGSVGAPQPAQTGRFFESAIKLGVLNGVGGSSVLALYLGSSSVGPNTEN